MEELLYQWLLAAIAKEFIGDLAGDVEMGTGIMQEQSCAS